jgi:UDP-N-acetylmuramoylalanine--D-glutamate ligase
VGASGFQGRKIGILGIGREGQSVRKYLRTLYPGIELDLISETSPDRLFSQALLDEDQLLIGPLSGLRLDQYDLLIRSPGISPYRKSIQQAKSAGVEITSPSNLWFASHPDAKTICVTGTKGKSTTSALIAHALASCGYRVRLAGNIGLPLLACEDRNVDWWVIELSSYQLVDLEAAPTASVILNLSADHLDWHGGEQAYRQDKLRLATLAAGSILVANAADEVLKIALSDLPDVTWFNTPAGIHAEGSSILDGPSVLPVALPEGLPGRHSLANTAAALTVFRAIGADIDTAIRAISSFRSLPHRLQLVGEQSGVRYINDSISSSPVATAAALEALAGHSVTLIVGGLDRGLDWIPYMHAFKKWLPKAVIAIPENGTRILDTMRSANLQPAAGLYQAADLADAVRLAQKLTLAGETVLLSPGAPSFPQFKDYRDRGRKFAQLCGFELEERDIW